MLDLNSLMLGTSEPKVMADFYEKVFDRKPDMQEDDWSGWQVGACFFGIGKHSEIEGKAKEPQRIIFNLATKELDQEFNRIKETGAEVIKEPYQPSEAHSMRIATFADPDGNYFQLMTPWEDPEKK